MIRDTQPQATSQRAGPFPVARPVAPPLAAAVRALEEALQAGYADPSAYYLLALARKRQGNTKEARQALRRITPPDAHVWLQLGLLSLLDKQLTQAEQEFACALKLQPDHAAACKNLVLTRLSLGWLEETAPLATRAAELAEGEAEQRLFVWLAALLRGTAARTVPPELRELTPDDEQLLLSWLRRLGNVDALAALLRAWHAARPDSPPIQEAYRDVMLSWGMSLLNRGEWGQAQRLLTPLVHAAGTNRAWRTALLNLLGCCCCLNQDWTEGIQYLSAALQLAPNDPCILQNLALAHEWHGDLARAEPYWNRYFQLLADLPSPSQPADYRERLAARSLCRLSQVCSDRNHWGKAVTYLERACQLRPRDPALLEQLFHLYQQTHQPGNARRTLARLKQLRPDDPQYELLELDFGETPELAHVEQFVATISRYYDQQPHNPRTGDRIMDMIAKVLPTLGTLSNQWTGQLNGIIDQVRRLPNEQINWPAVRRLVQELCQEFQRLRRLSGRCLGMIAYHSPQRRRLHELCEHLDRTIAYCQRWIEDDA
ncbi:MAG: tetratricopeptide repeat protein [Gemmataceae bacterium]